MGTGSNNNNNKSTGGVFGGISKALGSLPASDNSRIKSNPDHENSSHSWYNTNAAAKPVEPIVASIAQTPLQSLPQSVVAGTTNAQLTNQIPSVASMIGQGAQQPNDGRMDKFNKFMNTLITPFMTHDKSSKGSTGTEWKNNQSKGTAQFTGTGIPQNVAMGTTNAQLNPTTSLGSAIQQLGAQIPQPMGNRIK